MNQAGEELVLERKNLHFEYRCSKLPKAAVFVEGTLRLSRGDRESIASELRRARARRRSTQPLGQSSAGCVFKNPAADNPAGAIIDRLGFKGMTIGGAQVSEVHANFIVNKGNATARDVMALVEHIRDRVKKDQGVELELEIRVIGEEGPNA